MYKAIAQEPEQNLVLVILIRQVPFHSLILLTAYPLRITGVSEPKGGVHPGQDTGLFQVWRNDLIRDLIVSVLWMLQNTSKSEELEDDLEGRRAEKQSS